MIKFAEAIDFVYTVWQPVEPKSNSDVSDDDNEV